MIADRIRESVDVKLRMLEDSELVKCIEDAAGLVVQSYQSGGKVIFCGNGGSAADAQHLAAELSGKFLIDRPAIQAEACHVNGSFLTAVSNDYNFESAYARFIQASGRPGDILVAISTSGNSENIIQAIQSAKKIGLKCICLSGKSGGRMSELADLLIRVPSEVTPRIQEAHILVGHIICELVENRLFGK